MDDEQPISQSRTDFVQISIGVDCFLGVGTASPLY
jgi:hypothetical protein